MCFYWRRLEEGSASSELSIDEIRAISDTLGPLFQIVVSGGEPFLRDDLPQMAAHWHRVNRIAVLSIPTNALMPERIVPMVDEISARLAPVAVRINISLDGIGALHDEIRGVPGGYEKTIKTLEGLKTLKTAHANLAVNINSVLSSYNRDHIADVAEHVVNELRPDLYTIGRLRGESPDPKAADVTVEDYARASALLRRLEKACHGERYFFHSFGGSVNRLMRDLVEETERRRAMIVPCPAGTKLLVIDEVGNVYPCEMLQHLMDTGQVDVLPEPGAVMGSLREFDCDMSRLLNSERARRIAAFIKDERCWCTYECAILAGVLLNPHCYPMLAKGILGRQSVAADSSMPKG